ncbi:MAG: serine/threonine-protein kinase RsbW [Pseudonocardiales bacterium]|uniref:ATP-binding protein n=1 Tax=Pseudonocardia sp. TaxID=60912 RepID=UPI0026162216|nr:ATP-binding protein [Pseudonocardia sp.]MCW2716613.1 anti-sigma factor [Pseudonocardia sp.]MDT7615901.1 serine/threonine-protein kinase RsbW [Pseudonocardiales bacterium]MDT7706309.1 serine/threonine-protein kinase RsbW [Pseudonocardiales bacterium]
MSDLGFPPSVETLEGASIVEVRTSASAALIATIRAVASDLAARADFDLDAISDLRMAVDEACATLVDVAAPSSTLRCTFLVRPERIEVHAEVHAGQADAAVSTDTFGWRVLQTLADDVQALRIPGTDGAGPTVGIRLDKHAGDPSR